MIGSLRQYRTRSAVLQLDPAPQAQEAASLATLWQEAVVTKACDVCSQVTSHGQGCSPQVQESIFKALKCFKNFYMDKLAGEPGLEGILF